MPLKYNPYSGDLDWVLGPGSGTATIQFDADTGSATPTAGGVITVSGGANGIDTSATGNTLTISFDVSEQPAIPTSVGTDSGTATPAANSFSIVGGAGLNTSGASNTVTINMDSPVTVPNGGTGATTLTGVLTGNGTSAITANAITQYGVLIGGASNAVDSTAVGTATHILTSNGAGVAPTFQAAGGGGNWVYVSSATASASASISFTDLSTDVMYAVVVDSLTTGASSFYMRTSTNNGSSYDSGASDYGYTREEFSGSSSSSSISSAAQMSIWKPRDVSNGIIYLYRPSATDVTLVNVVATSWASSTYFSASYITSAARKSSADVDAIQFLGSTGTLTTGNFTLYKVTV